MNARNVFRVILAAVGLLTAQTHAAGNAVVVIANRNVSNIDATTLEKIYMGKVIEVNGVPVTAINANAGSAARVRFLRAYLNKDEDDYTAYWVTRRYVGKGAPPRELSSSAAILNYVKNTPGAIGYVDESDVDSNVNVLLK